MDFGDRIKARRTELGMTQEALAERAGISKGFLSDVENGKRNVSAETLRDLATVLNRTLDFLMSGEESESKSRETVQIPPALADLAERENIPFPKLIKLMNARQQIAANRTATKRGGVDEFDWIEFYK